jgi:hypothetical protein
MRSGVLFKSPRLVPRVAACRIGAAAMGQAGRRPRAEVHSAHMSDRAADNAVAC